jgi:hypothetical protein
MIAQPAPEQAALRERQLGKLGERPEPSIDRLGVDGDPVATATQSQRHSTSAGTPNARVCERPTPARGPERQLDPAVRARSH